jgi:hypothetical protein
VKYHKWTDDEVAAVLYREASDIRLAARIGVTANAVKALRYRRQGLRQLRLPFEAGSVGQPNAIS